MSESQPFYGKTNFKKKSVTSAADKPGLQPRQYEDVQSQVYEQKLKNLESVGFKMRESSKGDVNWFYFKVKSLIAQGIDVAALDYQDVDERFEALRTANSNRR